MFRWCYGSWDMVCDGCNYFLFWASYCPFSPITARKINILKNWKERPGDIIILHMCTKNYDQIIYGSWDMVRDRCNCYFSFLAIFCPFTPVTVKKIKILKKWKKYVEISSCYISVPKVMTGWCTVPEVYCATDGWMDGWKKWHIEVGAPPNKRREKDTVIFNYHCYTYQERSVVTSF